MLSYEIIEHIQCVIFIIKYLDYLHKLLKLVIFPSSYLWELPQNSIPNLKPIKFDIIKLYFSKLQYPNGHFGTAF